MQDFGRFKISFQTPLLRDYVVPGKYIELLDPRGFLLRKNMWPVSPGGFSALADPFLGAFPPAVLLSFLTEPFSPSFRS